MLSESYWLGILRAAFCTAAYGALAVAVVAIVYDRPFHHAPAWPKEVARTIAMFSGATLLGMFAAGFVCRDVNTSKELKCAAVAALIAFFLATMTI